MNGWKGGVAAVLLLGSSACAGTVNSRGPAETDFVRGSFPEEQAEIAATRAACTSAAMSRDWEALRSFHLESPKFSKITSRGDRYDFDEMIADEIAGVSAMLETVPGLEVDLRDQKIDVFGDTAVETAFLVASGDLPDGKPLELEFGVSSVWVRTNTGWKIAHEHATQASDIVDGAFPLEQAAVRAALLSLNDIGRNHDWEALRAAHLEGPKFSDFGPGMERQDFDQMLAVETAALSGLEDFSVDFRELRIDVFGDVAVTTSLPVYRGTGPDGMEIEIERRATMVYVRTPDGWKIAHEHLSKPEPE